MDLYFYVVVARGKENTKYINGVTNYCINKSDSLWEQGLNLVNRILETAKSEIENPDDYVITVENISKLT